MNVFEKFTESKSIKSTIDSNEIYVMFYVPASPITQYVTVVYYFYKLKKSHR